MRSENARAEEVWEDDYKMVGREYSSYGRGGVSGSVMYIVDALRVDLSRNPKSRSLRMG